MAKRRPPCPAILVFADDRGDNSCTCHCELEAGHEGAHLETGDMGGTVPGGQHMAIPYRLSWSGDTAEYERLWDERDRTADEEEDEES